MNASPNGVGGSSRMSSYTTRRLACSGAVSISRTSARGDRRPTTSFARLARSAGGASPSTLGRHPAASQVPAGGEPSAGRQPRNRGPAAAARAAGGRYVSSNSISLGSGLAHQATRTERTRLYSHSSSCRTYLTSQANGFRLPIHNSRSSSSPRSSSSERKTYLLGAKPSCRRSRRNPRMVLATLTTKPFRKRANVSQRSLKSTTVSR
ncbi:T27.1 [Tupaiid betaherpesvirus 1]|uniref:T27.1 n=1 Tax=Tupaiid herpesvirus 1 (strain 1) TaxID=10397 RepID=Q91TS1_TUHV1|nr:T27.1 [Tupaiid betaherpesvirus 1]AAK57066.1 T27.1 [Tupaiid betaherpesvirus 1]